MLCAMCSRAEMYYMVRGWLRARAAHGWRFVSYWLSSLLDQEHNGTASSEVDSRCKVIEAPTRQGVDMYIV